MSPTADRTASGRRASRVRLWTLLLAVFWTATCTTSPGGQSGDPTRGPSGARPRPTLTPVPYPFATPTPPPLPGPLDGVYTRVVTEEVVGGAGKCRRCPPYRLQVGPETLTLRRGAFVLQHEERGFAGVGSFVVEGDRIEIFNDPNCPSSTGTYSWRLSGSSLTLVAIDDDCAFGHVRQRYLTVLPWKVMRET